MNPTLNTNSFFYDDSPGADRQYYLLLAVNVDKEKFLSTYDDKLCHTMFIDSIEIFNESTEYHSQGHSVNLDEVCREIKRRWELEIKAFNPRNYLDLVFTDEFDTNVLDENNWL